MSDTTQADARRTAFLIAGSTGMLGTALQRVVHERAEAGDPICCEAPVEIEFDITDDVAVELVVHDFAVRLEPDERGVLVNAAAYTNVEAAEDQPEVAFNVNETGPGLLALAARERKLCFVHVSTDFVFDGTKHGPYTEDDVPNPLSVYGASKLAGEHAALHMDPGALIARTAWVFGEGGLGANFPLKILAAARERGSLRVVDDEIGSPTYTVDLARGIVSLALLDAPAGVYHLAGSGSVSRYDMAVETLRLAGIDVPVECAKSAEFPTKAARPLNSVLDCSKAAALGVTMPDWRDGLARYLSAIGERRV